MFSDLCDYTGLSATLDPEDVAELMDAVMGIAERVVGEHGGFVNQFYGDGILSVFGLDGISEESERGATTAALEIHEQVFKLQVPGVAQSITLQMHTGIHSGLVFADAADSRRGRYAVSGDPINVAARLCSSAAASEIVVSAETFQGIQAYFKADEILLSLRGKRDPLAAYRVHGRSNIQRRYEARTRDGLTPFVGRATELEYLMRARQRLAQGEGGAIALVGDAGIGKTRLLEEFRRSLGSIQTFRADCDTAGNVAPLQPVTQLLGQIFGIEAGEASEVAWHQMKEQSVALDASLAHCVPMFMGVLGYETEAPSRAPEETLDELVRGFAGLLSAISKAAKIVLLLDDWQSTDDASRWSFGGLVRAMADQAMLLVVTTRTEPSADPLLSKCECVRVAPWQKTESEEAVRRLVPVSVSDADARRIHEHAGGNPLFVEELCRATDAIQPAGVPSTLRGLLQSRVERLSQQPGRVVRVASVIGKEFSAELVAELCALPRVDAEVADLCRAGLIYRADHLGSYRFSHGIIRDVVYETVRIQERRALHARIASWLEQSAAESGNPGPSEALAYHYAGSDDAESAARYARLAGDRAAAISAQDRARHQYGVALQFLNRLPNSEATRRQWIETCNRWSAACVYSPDKEQLEVVHQYLRMAERSEDPLEAARAHYWLGWLLYALGEQGAAIEHTSEALAIAERLGESRLAGQLLTNLGQCYAAASEYPKSLRHLGAGLKEKRYWANTSSHRVPVGSIYGLGALALVHGDIGSIGAARQAVEDAMTLASGRQHAIEGSLLCVDAMISIWQGNWQRGRDSAEGAQRIAERVGGGYIFALSEVLLSFCSWRIHGSAEVLEALERGIQWFESRGVRLYLSFCTGLAAYAYAVEGIGEKSERYAQRTLDRCQTRDRIGEGFAHTALAICRANDDDASASQAHLNQALSCALSRGSQREAAIVRFLLGKLALEQGEMQEAKEQLEQSLSVLEGMETSWYHEQATLASDELARRAH